MRLCALLAFALLGACIDQLPSHVALEPQGENVEFAYDMPNPDVYAFVSQVTGEASSTDLDEASTAAENDLRNKAAALGATLVEVQERTGEPVLFVDKMRVRITGRAYKAVD